MCPILSLRCLTRLQVRCASPIARLAVLCLGLAAPGTASAGDGVVEIHQGLVPLVITQPGSYVLTGNIVVASTVTAITVTASDVTIDLNGFAIQGPIVCTGGNGAGTSCPGASTGDGIRGTGANITVRNGTIRGAGRRGIWLSGAGNRVERVVARSNGSSGIVVGGVGAGGSVVVESVAIRNNVDGIAIGDDSTADSCLAVDNGDEGIAGTTAAVVSRNVVYGNGDKGIEAIIGSQISENAVGQSGTTGIRCVDACLVDANLVRNSGGLGVSLGATSGLSRNVIQGNGTSPPVSGGARMHTSACDGGVTIAECGI